MTIEEALSGSEAPFWEVAIEEEHSSLLAMKAWHMVMLPPGKIAIPCKWVFKRKLNADGTIERYKARLVIKGFYQRLGIDYNSVFAPVVRASTVRLFLSIVASFDLECHSIDIKNAFIQGDVDEDIYMTQPDGYDDGSGRVCKLDKSLYGLKQAPRVWNKTLTAHILFLGFVRCKSDGALFMLYTEELGFVIILCYVDDIQVAAKKLSSVQHVKKAILSKFPGKDAGEIQYFLQMTVTRNRADRTIYLKQQRHIDSLIEQHKLQDAWPVSIPMITGVYKDPSGSTATDADVITQYKSAVGALLHISNNTRPDIAFAVSYLARFTAAPTASNFARLRDVLLYLKGTASYSLRLGGSECVLHGFCDSDYAGCPKTRKSTTGYIVKCGLGCVSWKSAKQATVSRSSSEAEYIAAGEIAKEVQYFYDMAPQMGLPPACVPVGIDNRAAKCLIDDPISAARTKHIEIAFHHVREKVRRQQMRFIPVRTADNPADILTKPLPQQSFQKHRQTLGVVP